MVVLGRSGWFYPYIGGYGSGMEWYDLIRSIMEIYYSFSIYKDCSLYTACSSSCFRTLRDYHFLYMIRNIYDFLYITSNVSKRQYHYNITFSKRYDGRRSLNLSTRGLYYNARSPTESMHIYYINFYNIYTTLYVLLRHTFLSYLI